MKLSCLLLLIAFLCGHLAVAEDFDDRAAFGTNAGRSVDGALKRAQKENKRVLVFVLDPKKKQAWHVQAMTEYAETKNLLKEHFLIVVTDFKDKAIASALPGTDNERPMFVLFDKAGKVIKAGTAAMGAANGNKVIKEWVATP